jgi:two-component system KDP operon response regulator KdpE
MLSSEPYTILVVDDDIDILRLLQQRLRADGYHVLIANSGERALLQARARVPHLAIMDIGLPDISGIEATRRLQRQADIPVIMLTALDQEPLIVESLETIADDYVTKPFSYPQLRARIERTLRRVYGALDAQAGIVTIDDHLRINLAERQVITDHGTNRLTPVEGRILIHLLRNRGHVVPTDRLLELAWGYNGSGDLESLRVRIHKLRQKVERDPEHPQYILTVRNLGYTFPIATKGAGEGSDD